jgi:RNA polymerase sigma factor (sigma-70 family)
MNSINNALRRTMIRLGGVASLTDTQLLHRFVGSADQVAFEQIVQRHGPMVLRVCQRVLRHAQDAEDAFQAAFIVLARKAGTVVKQESLSGWLYSVAFRIALKAKTQATGRNAGKRDGDETVFTDNRHGRDRDAWTEQELRAVLDAELSQLPEKYRTAIVLCYLQGKSQGEAAQLLHCAPEALKKRLFRARDLLRGRLARRGMTVAPAALGAVLVEKAAAAVPNRLLMSTVPTALSCAGAGGQAHALAGAVLGDMAQRRLARWALLVALALLGTGSIGVGLWGQSHSRDARTADRTQAGADGSSARVAGPRLAYFHGSSAAIQSVTIQVWNDPAYNLMWVYSNPPAQNEVMYPNGRFFATGVAPTDFTPPDADGNFSLKVPGTFAKPAQGALRETSALAVIKVASNGDPDPARRFTGTINVFAFIDGKIGQPLLAETAIGWK